MTQQWNLQPIYIGNDTNASFIAGRTKVEKGLADLNMCSMWMGEQHRAFDMSHFVDLQSGTFLVRKPAAYPSSSFFYLSLTFEVWIALLGSLVLIVVLQTVMVVWLLQNAQRNKHSLLDELGRSLMDVTSVVTGHGLLTQPIEISHKLMGLSLIFLSVLIGVVYTTRYTSLLTSPPHDKAINTLQDVLDNSIRVYSSI